MSTILVVEDSEEDFAMITHGFKNYGIQQRVVHLQHPKEVQNWLADPKSQTAFILLDLNLPGENGVNLIKAFKQHPKHAATPLAVFSTSANPTDIQQSYSAGANTYHVKPLETPLFEALITRIANYWFHDALTVSSFA